MFHRSDRLFLRPIWPEDAIAIYRGIADKEITGNLATAPWPYTLADAEHFVALPKDPMHPGFGITIADTGEYIGQVGFNLDEEERFQLGYWIARDHWGHGYATEAGAAALKVARTLGHGKVMAAHFLDNPASGRVLSKLGFEATGRVTELFSCGRGERAPAAEYALDLKSHRIADAVQAA